jgi:radical SAM superfamily enzyme YgiQ (UPF0313 family)
MSAAELNVAFIHMPTILLGDLEKMLSEDIEYTQIASAPLGIMYISSMLKKDFTKNIAIIDYVVKLNELKGSESLHNFISSTAKKSLNFKPDVLAFTFNIGSSYDFFKITISELKKIWPDAITVVGGTHATNVCKFLLRSFPDLDYVCRGEGEIAFGLLIKALSSGDSVYVKGVYNLDKIQDTDNRPLEIADHIENLDDIPFPDFGLIDMDFYTKSFGWILSDTKKPNFPISTTRGCPYKCTYCSAHTVHGRIVRIRSNENVIAEMKRLYDDYGVSLFIPVDDLFTFKKSRTLSLLLKIRELGIENIELQFPNALAVNTLDKDIIDSLCDTGTTIVCIAIESGSEYVQKNIIHKNVNLKKAKNCTQQFKSKGVHVRCYYIVGFPGETSDQVNETIEYAKSINADWSHFSIATPLRGSTMYQQFADMGCISPSDEKIWSHCYYQFRTFDSKEFTAEQINEIVQKATYEVNFFSNINMRNGEYEKAIKLFQYVVKKYAYNIIALYQIYLCYKHMNKEIEKERVLQRISHLINTDRRAMDLYKKYKPKLHELSIDA